ncbi:MAG: cytochrome c biogenesis protein ResB [Kineosporiaceae bacterium]
MRHSARLVRAWATSKTTAVTLTLTLGLLVLAGTVLAQVPDRIRQDPEAYRAWVEDVRGRYGALTPVLDAVQAFQVFHSVAFTVVTSLVAASMSASVITRLPLVRRRMARVVPPPGGHDGSEPHGEAVNLDRSLWVAGLTRAAACQSARNALSAKGFGVVDVGEVAVTTLHASRHRLAVAGSLIAHAGLVLVFIGVSVTAGLGFRESEFPVTVGHTVPIGHGTGLSVEAIAFEDTYLVDGSPQDYATELVLRRGAVEVARGTVRINHPLRHEGLSLYQSYFGTAAMVTVQDRAGRVLFDDGVALQWVSADERFNQGRFVVPGTALVVEVTAPASGVVDAGLRPGQVRLDVVDRSQGMTLGSSVLSGAEQVVVGDHRFTFQRERQFTGLSLSRDPGKFWVWTGSGLLLAGLFLSLFLRPSRAWVTVRDRAGGVQVEVTATEPELRRSLIETLPIAPRPGVSGAVVPDEEVLT